MTQAEPYESVKGCCDQCGTENVTIYRSEVGWICVPCALEDEEHGDYADLYLNVARGVLAAEHERARQAETELAEQAEQQKELALLRELRTDVERWREGGGDGRDVGYILDTLDKLEAAYPHQEDDTPRDPVAEQHTRLEQRPSEDRAEEH